MTFGKNLILVLSLEILLCSNVFAMRPMKFALESISSSSTIKVFPRMSRSFSSDEKTRPDIDSVLTMNKSQHAKEILEKPIIPQKKPPSYILPKNFFMEKRNNVTLENVNERIFHVHRNITLEKEFLIKNEIKQGRQHALFKKEDGKILDRRTKVKDPLSPQYLPICYLHASYKLSDKDSLFFIGSGFRNSLNQIVTAGHNLFIEEKDVEKYCEIKKILLPQKKFLFDKKFLTMQIIFGYREEQEVLKYTHISEVNGKHCFIHEGRDLGVIQLPISQKTLLDNDIGSLPTMFFPDQPHEYIDKNITIVGYPGEIMNPALHFHSGPIKNVDPGKVVFYDVDTTKGNSGSPGFNEIKNDKDIPQVFLTHTHTVFDSQLNAGHGYDQDFYDFMFSHAALESLE